GREAVEDLEMQIAALGQAGELDRAIERIGLDFQIATRLTSWLGGGGEKTGGPGEPLRAEPWRQCVAHGMWCEGMSDTAAGVRRVGLGGGVGVGRVGGGAPKSARYMPPSGAAATQTGVLGGPTMAPPPAATRPQARRRGLGIMDKLANALSGGGRADKDDMG